jgi:Hemolysin-type calcium-binding repeat (2 copies)./Haemolysin-type calcium binding protein related domain.
MISFFGAEGNDVLDGGVGNDFLRGGCGDDTYLFQIGYGNDIIDSYETFTVDAGGETIVLNENGCDVLQFGEGITLDGLQFYGMGMDRGDNLVIKIADSGETVTLLKWFSGAAYQVDEIRFADGQVL